jgi:hypothetical protein
MKKSLFRSRGSEQSVVRVAMSRMLVDGSPPHAILATGSKIKKLLGYYPQQLNGCILQTLEGPDTDTVLLHCAIKAAFDFNRPIPCQVVLYDSKGRRRSMIIICSKYFDENGRCLGCLITMKDSPAFTIGETEILLGNQGPWVLTSAFWPFAICKVSKNFTKEFMHGYNALRGSSLLNIISPHSESSCWLPLTTSAGYGRITAGTVVVHTGSGEARLCSFVSFPVVEWDNSLVTYLAVVLEPTTSIIKPNTNTEVISFGI